MNKPSVRSRVGLYSERRLIFGGLRYIKNKIFCNTFFKFSFYSIVQQILHVFTTQMNCHCHWKESRKIIIQEETEFILTNFFLKLILSFFAALFKVNI